VLAVVAAPRLYLELVGEEHLPARVLGAIRHFEWDLATFKVDWSLDEPIPWAAEDARRAPVVHVANSVDELTVSTGELACGLVPSRPFLVMGQYSMADETRAPPGKETAWAYTKLPQQARTPWDAEVLVDRIEARVEELAPGFRGLIRARHVLTPADMEERNQNLKGGAIGGGTAQLHQQLVFRPIPGLGRPETPVPGLYLASASAHPGGGVHGGPGAIAARAALNAHRLGRAATALGVVTTAGAVLGRR
jgi:phytoene dehydrogenase-like protein